MSRLISLRTNAAPSSFLTAPALSANHASNRSLSAAPCPRVCRNSQNALPHISVPSIIAELISGRISANLRFLVKSHEDAFLAGLGSPIKLHGKYQAKPD